MQKATNGSHIAGKDEEEYKDGNSELKKKKDWETTPRF